MVSVMPVLTTAKIGLFAGIMPAIQLLTPAQSTFPDTAADGKGDTGFIEGQVLEKGLPVSRRVMCYHRRTGMLIKHTRSSDNGYFRFNGLAAGIKVFVVSIDDTGNPVIQKAVIGDFVTVSGTIGEL